MKTKHLFIAVALVAFSFISKAQSKYQFMIIEYSTLDNDVAISIDGKEFLKERIDFEGQKKSGYNANPLLKKVNEYQDQDWEVMSFNTQIGGVTAGQTSGNSSEIYFAYLRKKK
jgi:hypothetical protein